MSLRASATTRSDRRWPRRLWRAAVLFVAWLVGFTISDFALALMFTGVDANISGELDLKSGARTDSHAFSSISTVLFLLTAAITVPLARWYRSSLLVTIHPVATRLIAWPLAAAVVYVALAAYEPLNEAPVRDGVEEQLEDAGLAEAQASCVANGLAASLPLHDNEHDLEITSSGIDAMLTIAATCELGGVLAPCAMRELTAIAEQQRIERPIDLLTSFAHGGLTRQDVEIAQGRC